MPRSSVFLRLQWPSSSSSECSHEISSCPNCASSIDSCNSRDTNIEIPLVTKETEMKNPNAKLMALSKSRSSPLVKWADIDPQLGEAREMPLNEKRNVEMRPKSEISKHNRMLRSLSTSSATVSTNTDPEDFIYVCMAIQESSTLPRNSKINGPRIIIPTSYKDTKAETLSKDDCQCVDIPYIDLKHVCEIEKSKRDRAVHLKPVKTGSKDDMFGLSKGRMFRSSPCYNKTIQPLLTKCPPIPETIREHCMPDILSNCNISTNDSTKSSIASLCDVVENKAVKKCVKFSLPPEYCDTSFISEADESFSVDYPPSGYAEHENSLMPPNGQNPYRNTPSPGMQGAAPNDRYVRWRDPDLHEVVDFLSNPNNVVKANAAAYLQHLSYMDDAIKQKTRILGGIPPLVALLSHDLPELHRNACGALRNLSYGRQNDENKQSIKEAGGIPALIRLLKKTADNEVKELVTGILWNLSSSEELKQSIVDDALVVLVNHVIIPCSGWDGGEVERDPNNDVWWSTVFKNASGIIRNISSAGEYARTKLRRCPGLVDGLFCVIKLAITGNSHDNKSVENCVCILRNLSYRCQEVEDPNYDKHQLPVQSRATATGKGDNLGCFGGSRKKKDLMGQLKDTASGIRSSGHRGQAVRGMELLWQPELVVQPYLALLSDCSNPETLEAAAGALQNLAACYWQPSIDVRAAVRKDKGLPILVELLRMEVDRVVCAVATALRNLAIDQRNKELIGKYAMRDLVQKLPSQNSHDTVTSDETIAAVLATLNEVIKKNAEFSRSLLDAGGVERLFYITKQRVRYASRVVKFASQVLFSMWGHQELREVYKKSGWKEQDFVSKSVAARNAAGANSPTANNTLNRPMASQGGTRYEDRTIQRANNQQKQHPQYPRREEVPLADLGYGGGDGTAPGGVRIYGHHVQGKPGEPVYAKVNREKKRNRQYDMGGAIYGTLGDEWADAPPAYSTINYREPNATTAAAAALSAGTAPPPPPSSNGGAAGDSWV